ncbi:DMT family transporter [Evansella sp. AB-P1]|uniref:DMT family transporter n=1 Tax=Evansella sp. AB-P1 TaxID=3037653 RepID=UPI00241EA97D|nr:DMT family transporter [Evansella sp. AB-P1]MDG5787136.1 DMT family transporter [Evansella sp. AB-P1]
MIGILFAVLSATSFATNYILIQKGMKRSEGDNGVYINILTNVVILTVLYLFILLFRSEPITVTLPGVIAFMIAGICTSFLGRATLFAGIRKIGSSRAAAIKNTNPVITIFIAILFLGERVGWYSWFGIAFILFGLFLTAYEQWKENGFSYKDNAWVGIFLATFASVSFGTGFAIRKLGMMEIHDPFLGALIGGYVAFIAYNITLLVKKRLKDTVTTQFKQLNIFYLLAGVATCFGVLSFFISAFYTQVSYTAPIVAIEPVITVILAYIFLKDQESIKATTIISAIFIFIGIVILSISSL